MTIAQYARLVAEHPLPWHVNEATNNTCSGERLGLSIWDADGNLIAEIADPDEDSGRDAAVMICELMNRAGPKVCECGEPATCFGSYETDLHPAYACDTCCGHGCEDGHCEQLGS